MLDKKNPIPLDRKIRTKKKCETMSGTKLPNHSDNFWSSYVTASIQTNPKNNENEETLSEYLSAVDESPEFYDPYSDLNLFLSQKIKQEMQHCSSSKWSLKIQEELLSRIVPDFRKKFPRYRLGTSALKKAWEKIAYYSQQIQQEKEAISQDGKLNIHFFIKKNLKNYRASKSPAHLHPSHFAHQLASKMSECIAVIDGVRPKLDYLTKMIWGIQRHLLPESPEKNHCPFDDSDKIDQLIVKAILEIVAKEPQISYNELEHQVQEALLSLHELPSFSSIDQMVGNVSALLAEKLFGASSFHTLFFAEQKTAINNFIRRHTSLCKTTGPTIQFSELVRRIIALYMLASGLPKTLAENQVKEAVLRVYPSETGERTGLPQAFWAFVSAELVLMRNDEFCRSPNFVAEAIWSAYREATSLPLLQGKATDILEIVIWKSLSESEGLLEKLPYRIGQRIEAEIANILIENPTQNFSSLVRETVEFFRRAKELVQVKTWADIERKIHLWVVQGDMLCRWIRLDQSSTLLRMICQKWKEQSSELPHHSFVSEICQTYLKSYPELAPYASQLSSRVWILYKYAWYALFGSNQESSFDRFLKWHSRHLLFTGPALDHDHLVHQLEEIVRNSLPLVPFERPQADAVL